MLIASTGVCKIRRMKQIWCFRWSPKSKRVSASRGGLNPWPGALPLDPAGGFAPRPQYRLALYALAMSTPHCLTRRRPWLTHEIRKQLVFPTALLFDSLLLKGTHQIVWMKLISQKLEGWGYCTVTIALLLHFWLNHFHPSDRRTGIAYSTLCKYAVMR